MKQKYLFGSVSSGTMRPEDLIPCFLDVAFQLGIKNIQLTKIQKKLRHSDKFIKNYFLSEDSTYDLDFLFENLNERSAPYFYFGSHPEDNTNYGFWLFEDFLWCTLQEGGILQVKDLSEIPKNYYGEILFISDHGNRSLYVRQHNGHLKEIWSIV